MATPLPVFIAQLSAAVALIDPLVARTAAKHGDKAMQKARKDVAKDTRSLMRSIKRSTPKIGAGAVTIVLSAGGPSTPNEVDYAQFVEKGTAVMAARPFMRPAVNHQLPRMEKDLANLMELLASGKPGRAGSVL